MSRPGEEVTAIVLCGGRGSRLGGVAKPLVGLGGKPLLAHVIERLRPQVDAILLSCATPSTGYERFGCPIVEDRVAGAGPLAGIASSIPHVLTPWTLTTPADTPFLPADLVAALAPACLRSGAAVPMAAGRRQNLTLLLDRANAECLAAFYAKGGRAAHRWLDGSAAEAVELPEEGLFNVNTPEDLAWAQRALTALDTRTKCRQSSRSSDETGAGRPIRP